VVKATGQVQDAQASAKTTRPDMDVLDRQLLDRQLLGGQLLGEQPHQALRQVEPQEQVLEEIALHQCFLAALIIVLFIQGPMAV
jgi:hypothetical protein